MTAPRTVLVAHPSADLYGSDRVLLESVTALVDGGWCVVVTVPQDGPLVPELRRRGAEVQFCPSLVLRKALLRPAALPQFVRQVVAGVRHGAGLLLRSRPTVVYVNTLTVPLWPVLARLTGCRVLVHVHEAERSLPPAVRVLLALPVAAAQVVLVNSRFTAGVLASGAPWLRRRTRVLLNGVPGPDAVTAPRDLLQPPLRAVYVGRLSPRKGVDVAVEAVGRLRAEGFAARLDLVGEVFPGYEWYERELRAQVARLRLDEDVAFRGFVDPVWPALAEADVVVVPSRAEESFGNTAVEAVLAARPVVVSAMSGLLEASAGYACAQTVPPGDAAAVAAALRRVAEDWATWRDAAREDVAEARRRHAPAVYRAAILAEVDDLAADRGA